MSSIARTKITIVGVLLTLVGCGIVLWAVHGRMIDGPAASPPLPWLPEVLKTHGLGSPDEPVTVTYHPRGVLQPDTVITLAQGDAPAPGSTKWLFSDPTPVWRCFANTKTCSFDSDARAGSIPWLVITSGAGKQSCRIFFDPVPGHASVLRGGKCPEGGEWTFDAETVGRLVDLLSSTPPTELGSPIPPTLAVPQPE